MKYEKFKNLVNKESTYGIKYFLYETVSKWNWKNEINQHEGKKMAMFITIEKGTGKEDHKKREAEKRQEKRDRSNPINDIKGISIFAPDSAGERLYKGAELTDVVELNSLPSYRSSQSR